ncbi:hypothetical protein INT45_008734 [Circinella minor]|uniref:No apical meristem-associated C-terminal domain-containing protein n=1 Tax=Circinella minor TaxID=1195481 RepID=A0A8H7S5M7_9FUNG|nr:hypothetical protein INT45_008734 [Circinella minor]
MSTATTPTADAALQEEKRSRGKNFEKKEDLQLVKAYLVTSKDSEINTDQSSDKFWVRVWSKYIEDGNETERNFNALRNRFHTQISPSCLRFSDSMSIVLRHPKSGENDEDKYRRALEHYEATASSRLKTFKFKHCFDILKQEDKWKPHTSNADEPHQEVDGNCVEPTGQQQATVIKKKRRVDAERANLIQNAKRVKCLKSIAESAQLMAEHAIMSVDMSKLTSRQKLYYTKKQQEIIERMDYEDGEDEEGEEEMEENHDKEVEQ